MLAALQHKLFHRFGRWLFQLRDAEQGEVFLSQRRVFIVPTKAGWGYGAMLLVLFIGSVNYSLSLGFAFTFLMGACAVIDMHLTFRNLAHLSLRAGRSRVTFAGDEAQFELHLINRREHVRYAVWIGFIDRDLPELEQAVDVPGQLSADVALAMLARERGWMKIPRIRLQTRFPLGLFRAWSYWKPDAAVLVYPQPEQHAPALPISQESNSDGQGQLGQEDDFAGIRAYQAGDTMQRLAWRQIARLDSEAGGSLVTKHFEGGSTGRIVLDLRALPANMDLEAKLSRLTRWVLEAESQGMPYAFRLGHVALEAGLGPVHQEACLKALALYGKS
jgi:uncharacterized protein (DUF58 family)